MPLFRYEVTDSNGKTLIGAMDAASEAELRQRLVAKGLRVNVVIPPAGQSPAQLQSRMQTPAAMIPRPATTQRTSAPHKELAVFFRGLSSLLHGGVTAHQALVQMASQTPVYGMRVICERMSSRVQSGQSLAEAMAEFPRAFPPHVVGVVSAGELGGFLPLVLADIALDYEIAQRASSRIIRWISWALWLNAYGVLLISPIIMLTISPGVSDVKGGILKGVMYALKYVVPSIVLVNLVYHGLATVFRQPGMRPLAHRLLLRVVWAGRASKERSLASFSRILWRLQKAGVLPIQAWDAASQAAENVVIASRLRAQTDAIRAGSRFSDALAATGVFSDEDRRVVAMAEQSGQTADVLERVAAYYEDAAMTSAGRARWLGLRVSILMTIIATGIGFISFGLSMQNMVKWVDWFFKVD